VTSFARAGAPERAPMHARTKEELDDPSG
jgi:hypothetical protein